MSVVVRSRNFSLIDHSGLQAVSIKGTFILFPTITRLALLILGCAVVEQSKLLFVLIVDVFF